MDRSVAVGEKKQSQPNRAAGEDHFATINVAFVQAVEKRKKCSVVDLLDIGLMEFTYTAEKEPHFHESYRDGQRKRIYDGLQPEHFFHYEYQLLPPHKGHQGQVFKTDVVLFGGVVSKIYTDKDSRVVQCWVEECEQEQSRGKEDERVNSFGWRHK